MTTAPRTGRGRRAGEPQNNAPMPASSPWLAVPGKSWLIACMISWSPPLAGRLDPATAMAMPDRIRASASTVRNSSRAAGPGWLSTAWAADLAIATARPSMCSPVSAAESSQSANADRLLITSPMPADGQRPLGARRTRSRSTTTATGRHHAVRAVPRLVLERADRRGDAVVGQAGRDRDHRDAGHVRGELGDVDGLAAADARRPPRRTAGPQVACRA